MNYDHVDSKGVCRVVTIDRNNKELIEYKPYLFYSVPPIPAHRAPTKNVAAYARKHAKCTTALRTVQRVHPSFAWCSTVPPYIRDFLTATVTANGKRCLNHWLDAPLKDIQTITKRNKEVEYYVLRPEERDAVRKRLRTLPFLTLENLDKKELPFFGKVLALLHVAASVKCDGFIPCARLYRHLKKVLDKDGNCVDGSQRLHEVQEQLKANERQAKKVVVEHRATLYMENDLFYAKQSKKKCTAKHVRKMRRVDVVFELPALNVLNDERRLLLEEQASILDTLKKQLRVIVQEERDHLLVITRRLAEMDVTTSWATKTEGMCKPVVSNKDIKVIGMYHPCVKDCVPNDVCMTQGEHRIVTGYVMAGKSTFMKTFMCCAYFHQIGMYVPARSFQCPLFDAFFRCATKGDTIEKSTFMVHCESIAHILKNKTLRSLVVIDECCSATNTDEGLVLCREILHALHGTTTFLSTHFREVGQMEERYHMESHEKGNTYKCIPGECTGSNGIAYCEKIGLPKELIEYARWFTQQ